MEKTVLVTGANSGFGYLIALKFARNGWKVYATARGLAKEGVKEMNQVAKEEDLSVEWLILDVTDQAAIDAAAKEVREKEGSLDLLVNNAGFGVLGPIETYGVDDFQKQFDANFFGVVRMVYAFLPLIKKSSDGRIINISSIAGITAAPAYGLYSSSKFAVEAYSEVLRYELADSGVKVSMVEPGGFDTKFSKNAVGLNVDEKDDSWFGRIKRIRSKGFLDSDSSFIKKARDPQIVANKVFSIANKRNPKLRNIVGLGTPTSAFFRKMAPDWLWEKIVLFIVGKAKKK